MKRKLVHAALSLAAASLLIEGQARAADFQVNTFTAANQLYPDVARAGDGTFVVVWETLNLDGQSYGIFGQRFDAAGARLGVEFQINTYTSGAQRLPALAMNDDTFVVVWRSGGNQDGSDYGIFGRRFDTFGLPLASEFQVNAYTPFAQGSPDVALADQGDFVVVWQSVQDGYGGSTGIFGRRFDSSGQAFGGEFRVNTYTPYTQRYPAVATDADNDFMVAWDSRNQDGGIAGSYGVFARRFDSAGIPLTAVELQMNIYTAGEQFFPDVAATGDGAFVVAWQSFQDGSDLGVFARRFDSTGSALAGELQVNAFTAGAQHRPAIGVTDAGGFLVAYTDDARDGTTDAIFARRFDSAGAALTADFQVNSYTPDDQRFPAVALGNDGGYVVAWQSAQQDGFGFGIFAGLVAALAVLDVDGDGAVGPLTDGLLVLREHFGFTGATLTSGALDPDCTRCSATEIKSYLDGLGAELDIDGNGSLGALTDGLLVLRYAFGFTGQTLVTGAVGGNCSRCTPGVIEPYLASRMIPGGPPI